MKLIQLHKELTLSYSIPSQQPGLFFFKVQPTSALPQVLAKPERTGAHYHFIQVCQTHAKLVSSCASKSCVLRLRPASKQLRRGYNPLFDPLSGTQTAREKQPSAAIAAGNYSTACNAGIATSEATPAERKERSKRLRISFRREFSVRSCLFSTSRDFMYVFFRARLR